MSLIKKIIKVGNSAGVILPRNWCGGEARIELITKPLDLENDLFKILSPYLPSILGIYLVGSYARGEQENDSDVDVLVISQDIEKEIIHRKYNISIYPLNKVKQTLESNPLMIYPRLMEARPILNKQLLEELKLIKINKNFKNYILDTKGIIKINKGLIEMHKLSIPKNIIYSLVLRLRAIFLINCIINEKRSSNKAFKTWLTKWISKEKYKNIYTIYRAVRDNKSYKAKVDKALAVTLLNVLEREIDNLEEKRRSGK